jgi:hypothetical protein
MNEQTVMNGEELEKDKEETQDNEVEALSNNKVDVEIEPDVKANRVSIQICSCSFVLNCFSPNREADSNSNRTK